MKTTNHTPSEKSATRLYLRLQQLALEKGPHSRLPSINELCEQFGTSRVTLSEALDLLEKQQIIYRQHSKGIFVSPKAYLKNVAVLIDASRFAGCDASSFWGALLYLLSEEAQIRANRGEEHYDFHFVLRTLGEKAFFSNDMLETIRSRRMHSIISIGLSKHEYERVLEYELPTIVFAGYGDYMVEQDQEKFLASGVQYLINEKCKNIGLWMHGPWSYGNVRSIFCSKFQHIIEKNVCVFRPELIRDTRGYEGCEEIGRISIQEQGYRTVIDVFGPDSMVEKPDGVIVPDDRMMEGALAAFNYLGVRPGRDVKIATHANANSLYGLDHSEGICILDFNPADLVRTIFHILDRLLAGEHVPPEKFYVQPVLRAANTPLTPTGKHRDLF